MCTVMNFKRLVSIYFDIPTNISFCPPNSLSKISLFPLFLILSIADFCKIWKKMFNVIMKY